LLGRRLGVDPREVLGGDLYLEHRHAPWIEDVRGLVRGFGVDGR